VWEYVDPSDTSRYEQNIITRDSLRSDGRYYIEMNLLRPCTLDTATSFVWRNTIDGESLAYKLAADSGESWVELQTPTFRSTARVARIFTGLILGHAVAVKRIDYYTYRIGDLDSLLGLTEYLASGFGLVGQDYDGFPVRRIRGAIIGGVHYGRITSVNGEITLPSSEPILRQNYPNPFNPSTRVQIVLPYSTWIDVRVYNLLGQTVAVLAEGKKQAGTHTLAFDSGILASGVYFCRLQTSSAVQTIKMSIVK